MEIESEPPKSSSTEERPFKRLRIPAENQVTTNVVQPEQASQIPAEEAAHVENQATKRPGSPLERQPLQQKKQKLGPIASVIPISETVDLGNFREVKAKLAQANALITEESEAVGRDLKRFESGILVLLYRTVLETSDHLMDCKMFQSENMEMEPIQTREE